MVWVVWVVWVVWAAWTSNLYDAARTLEGRLQSLPFRLSISSWLNEQLGKQACRLQGGGMARTHTTTASVPQRDARQGELRRLVVQQCQSMQQRVVTWRRMPDRPETTSAFLCRHQHSWPYQLQAGKSATRRG